jgi:hypothetical protein
MPFRRSLLTIHVSAGTEWSRTLAAFRFEGISEGETWSCGGMLGRRPSNAVMFVAITTAFLVAGGEVLDSSYTARGVELGRGSWDLPSAGASPFILSYTRSISLNQRAYISVPLI